MIVILQYKTLNHLFLLHHPTLAGGKQQILISSGQSQHSSTQSALHSMWVFTEDHKFYSVRSQFLIKIPSGGNRKNWPLPFRTAAKPPLGTRVLFRSPPTLFHSCEMGIKMGCENAPPLRNRPLAMKSTIYCENKNHPLASYLNVINSIFLFFNRSFELHIGDKEELNQSNLPSDPFA